MKAPKKQARQPKKIQVVEPLVVESTGTYPPVMKEKREYPMTIKVITVVPLPDGYVRCIVLKEHQGMFDFHKVGDIIDLPERRFKSESFRGLVKKYDGDGQPNRRR